MFVESVRASGERRRAFGRGQRDSWSCVRSSGRPPAPWRLTGRARRPAKGPRGIMRVPCTGGIVPARSPPPPARPRPHASRPPHDRSASARPRVRHAAGRSGRCRPLGRRGRDRCRWRPARETARPRRHRPPARTPLRVARSPRRGERSRVRRDHQVRPRCPDADARRVARGSRSSRPAARWCRCPRSSACATAGSTSTRRCCRPTGAPTRCSAGRRRRGRDGRERAPARRRQRHRRGARLTLDRAAARGDP